MPALQVQAGVALAKLGCVEEAEAELRSLLKEAVRDYPDLYSTAATALEAAGRPGAALIYYRSVGDVHGEHGGL